MEIDQQPQTASNGLQDEKPTGNGNDLVGGPFAVIESDPGVFTSLTRKLGIDGLELVEMYDIEPWAVDHLKPHGLVFCFMWRKDAHRPTDFNDPAAERVWFANQLSDDACATHAILNVLLNCPNIDIGEELRNFKAETENMSSVMRGLAVTNSPIIRPAHNSLARPSDLRASVNSLTITTFNAEKKRKADEKKAQKVESQPPPAKRAKVAAKGKGKTKAKEQSDDEENTENEEESYHFIGYVPAYGKVWELDGLKSGPLEVGELESENDTSGWMDVVRPALRMKMEKYGGSGNDGSNIRFSLLAIVDDLHRKASDELEFLRRDKISLERKLNELDSEWVTKVDPSLRESANVTFTIPNPPTNKVYANDFASRRMTRDLEIMNMTSSQCLSSWQETIQNAIRAKISVEDELSKASRANMDHTKRTFDYDHFIREYIQVLHQDGLLNALLDRDNDGKKKRGRKTKAKG